MDSLGLIDVPSPAGRCCPESPAYHSLLLDAPGIRGDFKIDQYVYGIGDTMIGSIRGCGAVA